MIINFKLFESKLSKYAIIKFNNEFLPQIGEIVDKHEYSSEYVINFLKKFDYWNYKGLSDIISQKGINRDILGAVFYDEEIYKKSNNKKELQKELNLLLNTNKYNL